MAKAPYKKDLTAANQMTVFCFFDTVQNRDHGTYGRGIFLLREPFAIKNVYSHWQLCCGCFTAIPRRSSGIFPRRAMTTFKLIAVIWCGRNRR